MFRFNRIAFVLLMLLVPGILYAEQSQLQTKLSADQNPILAPDQIIAMPYAKLFLGMNVVPMLVWDNAGGLISANDAYLQMIGYSRQEMQAGKIDWATITPAQYRVLDQNCIQQLKTSEYCAPYVKEYVRKDGKHIAVKLWNAHDLQKSGQNIAIILPLSVAPLN